MGVGGWGAGGLNGGRVAVDGGEGALGCGGAKLR